MTASPQILSSMTTDELLREVSEARASSPVINALAVALMREQDLAQAATTYRFESTCPVCLAGLRGKTDGLKMDLRPANEPEVAEDEAA